MTHLSTIGPPRVLAITPDGLAGDREAHRWIDGVLAGVDRSRLAQAFVAIQVRDKQASQGQLSELALDLKDACSPTKIRLVLNGDRALASELGLDGVHLTSHQLSSAALLDPFCLLGASCHSLEEILEARAIGAHYAVLGPIFDTPSKRRYGSPLGVKALEQARAGLGQAGLPVLALGGIDLVTGAGALEAGADGLAAIRSFSTTAGTAELCNLVADHSH